MSAPWRFGGLAPSRICAELWQRALLAPRFSFRGLCGPDTCLGGLSASPARRASQIQKYFPNGGRERHALPMERLFASKGPQRAGALFVDFPYVLVGVPPIYAAPAGRLCAVCRPGGRERLGWTATCMSRLSAPLRGGPARRGLYPSKSARKGASRRKPARNAGGCRAGDAERDMHVAKKLPRLLFSLYNRWEIPYNRGCVHRELRDPARAGNTKGRSMAWAW